jgi:hypothetical protein
MFKFSRTYKNQVIIVVDSSKIKGGGFLMIKKPHEKMQFIIGKEFVEILDVEDSQNNFVSLSDLFSSTDAERTTLLNFLRNKHHIFQKLDSSETQLLVLTDSQPLYFEVVNTSNKNALVNKQIREIQKILDTFSNNWEIKWHRRSTVLGRLGDAVAREKEISPTNMLIEHLKEKFKVPCLASPVSQKKMSKLHIVEPNFVVSLETTPNSTLFLFPPPNMPNPQFDTLMSFLKLRQSSGIIGIPYIDKLSYLWAHTQQDERLLVPLQETYFSNLRSLRAKNYKIIFFKFHFTHDETT